MRPNADLLRLLVAYEIIWDFLDSTNEAGISAGQVNGRRLHLALIEALDPGGPISDYYRHHPWRADGGYLRVLVDTCRESCEQLVGFERVRQLVDREARRAQVLAINHHPKPQCRDAMLRDWVRKEFPSGQEAAWFEVTGAASASLTVHVLLALAADLECGVAELERVQSAYFPWISAATTMLDSYVDRADDFANGDHSYVAHYPSPEFAACRIRKLIERSFGEARALRAPEQHVLIVACMAAMYLSKDSAWSGSTCAITQELVSAGGSLTKLVLPLLRLWRIAYRQRST
jgi:tetraprenyl-beta-curcumene synthase